MFRQRLFFVLGGALWTNGKGVAECVTFANALRGLKAGHPKTET